MIDVYRKPQKDCDRCGGTGVFTRETHTKRGAWVVEIQSIRCTCTDFHDPTPESAALEAWEDESE